VRRQGQPVFVSEYQAPEDIKVLAAFRRKTSLSANKRTDSIEKVFGNDAAVKVMAAQKPGFRFIGFDRQTEHLDLPMARIASVKP